MASRSDSPGVPVVVICGRPNVGKSSLLNLLARRRVAIVHSISGVTRDRVSASVEHGGKAFDVWDTGGMGPADAAELDAEIRAQIETALERADLVLFVVDAREGFNEADAAIARRLRRIGVPLLLVANKVDDAHAERLLPELLRLGLGEPAAVSALHGHGRTGLLDRIVAALPAGPGAHPAPALLLAVVGQQNVGKSTFVNRLANEERMIVSEIPGTTRDAVDVRLEWRGQTYVIIDTPGVKRRSKAGGPLDFYSVHRAERSIRRADVTLLLIDAARPIGRTDKRLAAYIEREAKPCVIVVNKWDLAAGVKTEEHLRYLESELRPLSYAPVVFASALEGTNVAGVMETARDLHRQAGLRIGTGELNRALQHVRRENPPPVRRGRASRILYGAQVSVHPPTFALFVNRADGFDETYRRYLANVLRRSLGFSEVPVRIHIRLRSERAGGRVHADQER